MGSAIAFMYDFGEMPLLADQPFNGLIEHHRKPLSIAAYHLPRNLELIFKFENREFEFDGLPLGNSPPGVDKHPGGTDIFNDIPESPLPDGIFRNNERRPAGESTLVMIGFWFHWLYATVLNIIFYFTTTR